MEHFAEYALHVIETKGPQSSGVLLASFVNQGNARPEGGMREAEHALEKDGRFEVNAGLWSAKPVVEEKPEPAVIPVGLDVETDDASA